MEVTPLETLVPIYEKAWQDRHSRYGDLKSWVEGAKKEYAPVLHQLNNQGFAILKKAIDPQFVLSIKKDFDDCIRNGQNISRPRNISHYTSSKHHLEAPKLSDADFFKGVDHYRNLVCNLQMRDPLIHSRGILEMALGNLLLDVSAAYLDCVPALGYVKAVRSFANDLPAFDTQAFHIDESAAKMIKAFVYLNDVDIDTGPFCYVKGSIKNRDQFWGQKDRWSDEELAELYGKEAVLPLTANVGDVIFADTTAFHRGLKPTKNDRYIVIFNYGLHPEYTYGGNVDVAANLARSEWDKLTPKQKAVADLLNLV